MSQWIGAVWPARRGLLEALQTELGGKREVTALERGVAKHANATDSLPRPDVAANRNGLFEKRPAGLPAVRPRPGRADVQQGADTCIVVADRRRDRERTLAHRDSSLEVVPQHLPSAETDEDLCLDT